MVSKIEDRINQLGIKIPQVSAPAANYVPYIKTGNQVFISGQLPAVDGKMVSVGKVGGDVSIEDAAKAAEICALNIVAVLKSACDGDLEKVVRCVKLGIFVNAGPDFKDHPKVGNGASNFMVEIFDEKGKHARFAMGAGSLPFGVSVEIDAVFEIK